MILLITNGDVDIADIGVTCYRSDTQKLHLIPSEVQWVETTTFTPDYTVATVEEMEMLIIDKTVDSDNINEICYVSGTTTYYVLNSGGDNVNWDDGLEFGKGKDAINVILSRDTINIPYLYSGVSKDSNDKYITVSAFFWV